MIFVIGGNEFDVDLTRDGLTAWTWVDGKRGDSPHARIEGGTYASVNENEDDTQAFSSFLRASAAGKIVSRRVPPKPEIQGSAKVFDVVCDGCGAHATVKAGPGGHTEKMVLCPSQMHWIKVEVVSQSHRP